VKGTQKGRGGFDLGGNKEKKQGGEREGEDKEKKDFVKLEQ